MTWCLGGNEQKPSCSWLLRCDGTGHTLHRSCLRTGEFAFSPVESRGSLSGVVRNPYDLTRTPAGIYLLQRLLIICQTDLQLPPL